MIRVLIPYDPEFNYNRCKKLYEHYQKQLGDETKFEKVIKNTFFYSFFDDDKHIGCIYYYMRGNKLFVNAFANRHTHLVNIQCLKMSFDWFNCDIYAETKHKTAAYCLLKCGFVKETDNIYRYKNNKQSKGV